MVQLSYLFLHAAAKFHVVFLPLFKRLDVVIRHLSMLEAPIPRPDQIFH